MLHPQPNGVMQSKPRLRGVSPEMVTAARRLRRALTPAEATLWAAIRKCQVHGLRFRCQHPIGHFILDFYCPAYKLAIEVDGALHQTQQAQDLSRTLLLNAMGIQVLRFTNSQVLHALPTVLQAIYEYVESPLAPTLRGGTRGSG
jgi:very-short-patch-repair endonuclease